MGRLSTGLRKSVTNNIASNLLRPILLIAAADLLSSPTFARAQAQKTAMLNDVRTVSPALARYTQNALTGDLWRRPGTFRCGFKYPRIYSAEPPGAIALAMRSFHATKSAALGQVVTLRRVTALRQLPDQRQ